MNIFSAAACSKPVIKSISPPTLPGPPRKFRRVPSDPSNGRIRAEARPMMPRTTKPEQPDLQDFVQVERTYGMLAANASEVEKVNRYRLAQAAKLIRLYGEKLEI
jgi:hypothetical protein